MNKLADIVIDRVENGIIVINRDFNIVVWNKWLENYSDVKMSSVIGKSIFDILPLFQKTYYKQIFHNAVNEHQSMFCSGAIHSVFVQKKQQKNNDDLRQNMRVEPIEFSGEVYVLLQINDISTQYKQVMMLKNEIAERKRIEKTIRNSEEEMKKLKDEALQASKAKTEFLAVMSHEIRTPMNAIIGIAELLQETELTKEQRDYVFLFQKSGENLLRIINDILDISKIEAGTTEFVKKQISLPQFLEEVVATYSFQARRKGLAFEYAPVRLPDFVYADPTRLHQIISNVVSNAIKFTEVGSVLFEATVTALSENKITLQFKVIDTGIGIPKEKRDVIFERFTQVDSSTTRKFGGAGLGLAIVKRLVDGMNGTIQVEGDDRGSTFIIHVDLETIDENESCVTTDKLVNETPLIQRRNSNYYILLAEDSPDNATLIKAFLKHENMVIDVVENGYDALHAFQRKSYDLIIMDIEMPKMDGLEATRRIRHWEQAKGSKPIPIVALTAHALGSFEQKTIEAGCNLHLIKPIKKQQLITGIYKALE